jgi:glutamate 5-kinase
MRLVVKIGSSSLTDDDGVIASESIHKLSVELAQLRALGHEVVVVSSGAVASGLPLLGFNAASRPTDSTTLQAVSAVGQARLMQTWNEQLAGQGLVAGQVLLAPHDFMVRAQYLFARVTLERLIELGVIPVVNENDAVADDEIRFGDNDRIAALVAHLISADLLVLLTDMPGLMNADPRSTVQASLIEEIIEIDHELEQLAGGAGSARGSGGMASKLSAAKIAAWSGVRTVIAAASRPEVLRDAVDQVPGVGTTIHARDNQLSARKLWIAFALPSAGRIQVDAGAVRALSQRGTSLLAAGVTAVDGQFEALEAVEIVDESGNVVAKGLTRLNAQSVQELAGRRSSELVGRSGEIVHCDDLVILP